MERSEEQDGVRLAGDALSLAGAFGVRDRGESLCEVPVVSDDEDDGVVGELFRHLGHLQKNSTPFKEIEQEKSTWLQPG